MSQAVAQPASFGLTRSRGTILLGILLGVFVSALDATIVGTAMPKIIAQLNGIEKYSWVFTAYMLTETVSTPIWGKLSDLYGRKWMFLTGIIIFLIGSVLSGAATTMDQLIVFRGLQGLGGGAMLPIAVAIIGDLYAPAERAKYQGLVGAVFGLSSIFGPALGGYITDNLNWRWVFYINLPVGVVAVAVLVYLLPRLKAGAARSIDYRGAVLLVAGMVPLLLAFTWAGSEYAWASPQILGLFAVAIVALVAFALAERRAEEPIIPLTLFRSGIFTVSTIAYFIAGIGVYGGTLYASLLIQGVLGQSATNSGLAFIPTMLGFIVGSIVGGQIVGRTGRYRWLCVGGFLLAAVGMFLLANMGAESNMTGVILSMVIFGLGSGSAMMFNVIVQNAVSRQMMGVASSSLTFFRMIGATVGTAVLGSALSGTFDTAFNLHLPPLLAAAMPADRLAQLRNPQILLSSQAMEQLRQGFATYGQQGTNLFNALLDTIRTALALSLHDVFALTALFMLAAALICLLLKEIPLRRREDSDATASFH